MTKGVQWYIMEVLWNRKREKSNESSLGNFGAGLGLRLSSRTNR